MQLTLVERLNAAFVKNENEAADAWARYPSASTEVWIVSCSERMARQCAESIGLTRNEWRYIDALHATNGARHPARVIEFGRAYTLRDYAEIRDYAARRGMVWEARN